MGCTIHLPHAIIYILKFDATVERLIDNIFLRSSAYRGACFYKDDEVTAVSSYYTRIDWFSSVTLYLSSFRAFFFSCRYSDNLISQNSEFPNEAKFFDESCARRVDKFSNLTCIVCDRDTVSRNFQRQIQRACNLRATTRRHWMVRLNTRCFILSPLSVCKFWSKYDDFPSIFHSHSHWFFRRFGWMLFHLWLANHFSCASFRKRCFPSAPSLFAIAKVWLQWRRRYRLS